MVVSAIRSLVAASSFVINFFCAATIYWSIDNSRFSLNQESVVPTRLASYFGARCNGVSDDTEGIRRAIDESTKEGSIMEIPHGATCVTNQQLLSSNSHVRINGTLRLSPNSNQNVLAIDGSFSNIIVDGTGVIDGNSKEQTSGNLSCFYSYGPVSNITIKGITLTGCKNYPVNIVGGTTLPGAGAKHVRLQDLTIMGGGNSTEFAQGCDDCTADNLSIKGNSDYAFAFYGNVTNSSIKRSKLTYSAGGVVVLADGSPQSLTAAPSSHIIIFENLAQYNSGPGYYTWNTAGTGRHDNISFVQNKGDHNNQGNTANYGCITLSDASYVVALKNDCHDDGTSAKTVSDAIFISDSTDHVNLYGNLLYNEGIGSGGGGQGVFISAGAMFVTVEFNKIYDNQTTKSMAYGINGSCSQGAHCRISGNLLGGFIGSQLHLSIGTDSIIKDNIFFK